MNVETTRLRGYAICGEARSGSSYLGRLLASTGLLGQPLEYFNGPSIRNVVQSDYPLDPEAQLAAIPRLGATANGVYGVKVLGTHFDAVTATRWAERLPNLSFISLRRDDLLAQAISHVRAMQTKQWTSFSQAGGEAAYHRDYINNEIVRLARQEARWRYFFGRNGLPVLWLTYEQVAADPQGAVNAVARLVGLETPAPIEPDKVMLRIQRDDLSEAWRARFLAEARDLGAFH
jgi:LPS sulfotransferase NodH